MINTFGYKSLIVVPNSWAFYLPFSPLSVQQAQSCKGLGVLVYKILGFQTLCGYIKFKKMGEEQREAKPITQQCFAKGYSKARSSE